LPYALL